MKTKADKADFESQKPTDVMKEATHSYFEMLNKSLSRCSTHKSSNQKELKRGARITRHRITL